MENRSVLEEYKKCTQEAFDYPEIPMGPWSSHSLINDPRHLAFVLSRYKFCAKMLEGKGLVVEVGSGDGFGIPIIAQTVKQVLCVDWDERNLDGCARRLKHLKNVSFKKVDLNQETLNVQADAVFSIDVIEHIEPENENRFMKNLCSMMEKESVLITGTPNIHSSPYACKSSEILHINLKSPKTLRELTLRYFQYEFSFGMNDEVLHTGFGPMCHYLWSIGAHKK
ncbi:MAG TPA: class I SAM-dependent methyltransferase [Chlamydiales bacterium]|nr:class I SAM-dependent methyltransferase [Chlamydiales bacterium]